MATRVRRRSALQSCCVLEHVGRSALIGERWASICPGATVDHPPSLPAPSADSRSREACSAKLGDFASALRRAKRRGGWAAALHLWYRRARGGSLSDLDEGACAVALSCMARSKHCGEDAVALLMRMQDARVAPSHVAIGSAVAACAAGGRWEEACSLLTEVESWEGGAGAVAYNAVISACGHTRSPQAAIGLLSRMEERRVSPTVVSYGAAIGACSRCHEWQEALRLLCVLRDDAVGIRPDYKAHAAVTTACARAVVWRHALALIHPEAVNDWNLDGSISPAAYTAAISACDRVGLWEKALDILYQMRDLKLERVATTFNASISACGRASAWEAALELWSEARSNASFDWLTAGLIVRACERAGRWTEALALFDALRLENAELGSSAFDAAISACALGRRWSQALVLLRHMVDKGIPLTRGTKNSVLRACEGQERLADATSALSLLRAGVGMASTSSSWQREGVHAHRELTEAALAQAASQVEERLLAGEQPIPVPSIAVADAEPSPDDLVMEGVRLRWPPAVVLDDAELESQKAFVESLRADVQREVTAALRHVAQPPGVHAHLVGSRLYGAAVAGADVDIVVEMSTPTEEALLGEAANDLLSQDRLRLSAMQALLRLRRHLEADQSRAVWTVIEMALDARRPTLRLSSASAVASVAVEVSFDQSLATLRKSELLARLAESSPAVLRVARLLRLWAERRGIAGQRHGYLSGYAWCLMAVFYCQCRGLLGGLQPRGRDDLAAFASPVAGADDGAEAQGGSAQATAIADSLGVARGDVAADSVAAPEAQLLAGAFAFYARGFRWGHEVVDVQAGRRTSRPLAASTLLCIADPVEAGVDLAAPYLSFQRGQRLRAEFRRAHRLIRLGDDGSAAALRGGAGAGGDGAWNAVFRQRPRSSSSPPQPRAH
eukprot:TRINITY_DN21633_c0_g2_i1.p1 TRINITY_DN21633_c0_g2~~TRINITY_DN21633_c0_g2_i1.p1  ORF type:complete len:926 (+),score=160.55 TRINITY_DN21633_c0_g2_i1:63-2780(+)